MQTDAAEMLTKTVLEPLPAEEAGRITIRAEKAAATKVELFTMVRGEY